MLMLSRYERYQLRDINSAISTPQYQLFSAVLLRLQNDKPDGRCMFFDLVNGLLDRDGEHNKYITRRAKSALAKQTRESGD